MIKVRIFTSDLSAQRWLEFLQEKNMVVVQGMSTAYDVKLDRVCITIIVSCTPKG